MTPAQILGVAGRFESAGNDLLTALTRTRARLASLDARWGGDEEGEAFAKNYLPAVQKTFDAIGLLAGAVSGIGHTLALNAHQLASYEEATTAHLTTPVPPPTSSSSASPARPEPGVSPGSGSG